MMKNIYKIIFLLLPFSFCLLNSFSQTAPAIEWAKCYGGTHHDGANSIQPTNDGGYIISGSTASIDGDVSGFHGGNSDYWVIKIDSLGDLQWQKCLGGTFDDYSYSIQQTIDNGFITTGICNSIDGDVTGSHGAQDFWIVKLFNTGNIQWQKCLGGNTTDNAYSIQQTQDSGYIVAGMTTSNNNGDVTNNHGAIDFWVVKIDSIGNIEWQKCLGGSNSETAHCVKQTQEGGYIVTGSTNSNDGDVNANHGNTDIWTVKLDNLGSIQWQKCLGGSSGEDSHAILQTFDLGYIIVGETASNDGDVNGNHGSLDYWIVKLDSIGGLQWQKCFGGTSNDEAFSIWQTIDSGYVVAGFSQSFNGDVSGNHGYYDHWIAKLDNNGNLQWNKCLGGINIDVAKSIYQTTVGEYIIAGFAHSVDGDVMCNHDTSGAHSDLWIVKLYPDTITGISPTQSALGGEGVSFAPNPLVTQSVLVFSNPQKEKFLFTLYDITGRVVETQNIASLQDKIILTKGNKDAGVYLFKLENSVTGEKFNGKIIVR